MKFYSSYYDNDVAALKPEWWALESLAVLEEELVVANLVNRDFDNFFVNAGDTVHVNKPGTFTANHKVKGSTTTVQDATSTDLTVKLNQHIETTFVLDDRDIQNSLPDLRAYFLAPAVRSLAKKVDAALVGEAANFYANSAGQIGVALTDDALINLGRTFDENLCPVDSRVLVVGPSGKADLLRIDRFIDYDKTGNTSGLLTGQIGQAMGFNVFMSQTVGSNLRKTVPEISETVNGAKLKGATSLTIDSATGGEIAGSWFTIDGTDGVYYTTAAISSTDTTINFLPALRDNVADNAVITFYAQAGDVKGAHAAGAIKIITDGYAAADDVPTVGQGITFGSSAVPYTVVRATGTWASSATEITLELNRPLDSAVSDDATIHSMPGGGQYNFAFRPSALTLVNRPLAPASAGVAAAVQNNGAFAIRVTIGYDMDYMKHKITLDTLLGVKVLDTAQGGILLN